MRLTPAPEIVKLTASLDDLALRNLLQPLASAAASAARRRRSRSRLQAAVVAAMALSLSAQVAWSAQCKPHHFGGPTPPARGSIDVKALRLRTSGSIGATQVYITSACLCDGTLLCQRG